MLKQRTHKSYCFAGQPAPCKGYFAKDILPCICGDRERLLSELSRAVVPSVPVPVKALPEVRLLALSA
jgi:hypothetical protein